MRSTLRISAVAFGLGLAAPAFPADSAMAVNRGLPPANLNNASGPVRSNVRWGWHDHGFLGDEFTVGAPGERWVIDSIRTWTVPGDAAHRPEHVSDFFSDVRLYFGGQDAALTPVSSTRLTAGSEESSNSDVRISEATQEGALFYDDFGTSLRIWQVDFANLNLAVEGGVKYRFGVWGNGRAIPDVEGKTYMWYNHASNAQLSGVEQDGADGVMLLFDAAGRAEGVFRPEGNGWDKGADINVQIFAHRATRNPRPTR